MKARVGSENAEVMMPSLVDSTVPLEDGSRLCTLPIAEIDEDPKFRMQIAFGEPDSIRGKEISSTLRNHHRVVKKIMRDFHDKGLL